MHLRSCAKTMILSLGITSITLFKQPHKNLVAPYVSISLASSGIPSVNIPPPGAPNLGRWGNIFFWWLAKFVLNKGIKPFVDRLRIQQGLAPADDVLSDVWYSRELNLIAVSPELCDQQIESIRLFTQAAELVGCRAIIQASLWKECQFESSSTIHYVSHSPYGLVFPKCAVVVHHGGAGTSQAATLAGASSIVVAHTGEQKSWGAELKRIGVAPDVLVRKNLTSTILAKKIKFALRSLEMQERTKEIGKSMRKEDGVRKAVDLISEKFKI